MHLERKTQFYLEYVKHAPVFATWDINTPYRIQFETYTLFMEILMISSLVLKTIRDILHMIYDYMVLCCCFFHKDNVFTSEGHGSIIGSYLRILPICNVAA